MVEKSQVTVFFEDVTFSVKEKKEQKQILKGVSGCVQSGEMLSILGPSGSGKTSLIQIISQRLATSGKHTVGGKVLCNGKTLTPSQFQRISGLVTQEDLFNASLTVRETLSFGAKLRLNQGHKQRVEEIISMLNLEDCSGTKVGDDSNIYFKGISGGEKRRLAIASEILDPNISVLVLDEPTSGLDAAAALNVVRIMRKLSDAGMTVITTLHQPRASIMTMFQQLMVLSQGRRIFYGQVADYIPYLSNNLQFEIPVHESPYDSLLDALNPSIGLGDMKLGSVPADCQDISKALADAFDRSELLTTMTAKATSDSAGRNSLSVAFERQGCRVGWLTQFSTVLHRTFLIKLRDPAALATQMSTAIFMGVLFGALYWDTYGKEPQYALLDAQMAVTMTVVMGAFTPFDVVLTFPMERRIFLRERRAGLYCSSSLFFGRILADMPQHMLAGALLAALVYPMAGLRMGFGYFLLVNVAGLLVGAAVMQAAGALARTFEEANMLVMVVLMMSMILSSSFVRSPPVWLEWAREISIMGLLGDICSYWEFMDVANWGLEGVDSLQDVADMYGLQVTSEDDMQQAWWILFIVFIFSRLVCFLGVKFLHTGKSLRENLWE